MVTQQDRFFLNMMFTFVVFTFVYTIYLYDNFQNQMETAIETYKMYHDIHLQDTNFGINGIYYADSYYCIWTKDRKQSEINETILHEECHNSINNDYWHFCK